VIGTVAAAALTNIALKALVERPQSPADLQLRVGGDHSFPSGHVTGTAALLGIIAVCAGVGRSRTVQAWLAGSVVAGVLVVAVTRLYLRAHWLTDVIGGGSWPGCS
jgi:membrane-associated phospholipid phosphatase